MEFGRMNNGLGKIYCIALVAFVALALNTTYCGFVQAQSNETDIRIELRSGAVSAIDLKKIESEIIYFQVGNGIEQVNFEEVAQLHFSPVSTELIPARLDICLQDDSRLQGKTISITENRMKIEFVGGWSTSVPKRLIRWIRLKDYNSDAQLLREWKSLLDEETRNSDTIVVNRDGELEAIEGILGDLQNDKIGFTIGERTANVELEKIDAILFFGISGQKSLPTKCRVRLKDGSQLNCQRIGWQDNQVSGTTASGFEFRMPQSELSLIDFAIGRDVFLDQLKPTTNDWKPLIASAATIDALRKLNLAKINQTYDGQPLSLLFENRRGPALLPDKKQFEHGFAVRGGGKLAFGLDENMTMLTGLVGFDPAANRNGEVLLTIRVDGKIALEEPLRKRNMANPLQVEVDISGARRIVFQVDYLDGRSVGDQIHLVDLKVSK
jgi:hypothetical protein